MQVPVANEQPTSVASASFRAALRSVQSCWTVPAEVQAPARTGTHQFAQHNHRLHKSGINDCGTAGGSPGVAAQTSS